MGTRIQIAISFVVALCGFASTSTAVEREYTLTWRPSTESVAAYVVAIGFSSGRYTEFLDLGVVWTDASGLARASLTLDDEYDIYIAMKAYNYLGQSTLSNEFVVEARCGPDDCSPSPSGGVGTPDDAPTYLTPIIHYLLNHTP